MLVLFDLHIICINKSHFSILSISRNKLLCSVLENLHLQKGCTAVCQDSSLYSSTFCSISRSMHFPFDALQALAQSVNGLNQYGEVVYKWVKGRVGLTGQWMWKCCDLQYLLCWTVFMKIHNYFICICIWYNFSTQRWCQYLKSYLMEDEGPCILYTQKHGHLLFGDA